MSTVPRPPADVQLDLFPAATETSAPAPERWLPIPDWPGYEASDSGQIRSWIKRGGRRRSTPKILRPQKAGAGYRKVANYINGHHQDYVHRLVLLAFVGPCPADHECRHRDNDRSNNRLSNLKWVTAEENMADKVLHGTITPWVEPPPREPFYFLDPFIPVEALIPDEVWKEARGYPGYEVSSWGRIGSYWTRGARKVGDYRTIRKQTCHRYGHRTVAIRSATGKKGEVSIHRLVLKTFSPQDDPSLECRHLSGIASENHISGLRWSNHTENMRDRTLHGTDNRGSRCGASKLNETQVREIRRRAANRERSFRLAKEFGVSQTTIYEIRRNRTWRHLV